MVKSKSTKHSDKSHKKKSKKDKERDRVEDKLRLKEAKAYLKKRLKDQKKPEGRAAQDNSLPPPGFKVSTISQDDYFEKNPEFSAWLSDTQGVHFNDLEAEVARNRFQDFVTAWNQAAVPLWLYNGVEGTSLKRTQHSWGFQGSDNNSIVRGMEAALEEEREAAALASAGRQVERRKWKEDQQELLDQMLPPPTAGTGAARIEARAARREERRAREDSPDAAHLPGGGDATGFSADDSFAAARRRQMSGTQKRQQVGSYKAAEAAQKVAEYGRKEDATMAQFRALLDKGPISIAKR